uniref:Retrovirus-related Pol polyprotein from transposon TNT 1-94 n=1 Tax=Tanacetum cinerariifolium TaxID=118510 RepID=A0A699GJ48_TANCI|nr:hypothetical protein [Tanacetum cinerariifolium]
MKILAEFMIIAVADKRPLMLEKYLYDAWKSRMELYIENRENGRMILNSVQNGPLVWPTVVKEDGTTRTKRYKELSVVVKLQVGCDLKSTNIILQGLPPDVPPFKMAGLLCNKFKEGKDKVMLVLDIMTEDFDAYDSDCDDVFNAKAVLMANLSSYGSDVILKPQVFNDGTHKQALGYQNLFYLKKTQRIKPTLYDGSFISSQHASSPVIDDEETLILEEVSQSKMLEKQSDPMSKENKVNTTPINYVELNRLSEDFGKRFTPQQELPDEHAFWLQTLCPNTDQSASLPVKTKVPKELPKVILVNTSLKKLRHHLGQFDTMVKKRITPDAITEGEWGFEHTKTIFLEEIIPFLKTLKDIFNVLDKDLLNEDSLSDNKNALEIPKYFKTNDLKAQLQAKDTTIYLSGQIQETVFVTTSLQSELRRLNNKHVLDNATTITNATTIALGMFKLDISHILKNNKDAHEDYLKKTIENTDTKRGLVKHSRKQNPSEPFLDSACKFTKHVQELLVFVSQTCPSFTKPRLKSSTSASRSQPTGNERNDRISQKPSSNMKNNVEVQRRRVNLSSNKNIRVKDLICDANVKPTMLNVNSKLIRVKCKQCMFDANHDVCSLKFVNDVNVRSKSKSDKKNQQHSIWKPTGKVFTEVGYKWKPIGRLFNIVDFPSSSFPINDRLSTLFSGIWTPDAQKYDMEPLSAHELR